MFKPCMVVFMGSLLALAACTPDEEVSQAAPADQVAHEVSPTWREDRLAVGRETYQAACASCHESTASGAPRTGHPEDWAGRSDLWQAVLSEHAKSGYLEMPEKGGQSALSDDAVEAAMEYMLGQTFPEKLTD